MRDMFGGESDDASTAAPTDLAASAPSIADSRAVSNENALPARSVSTRRSFAQNDIEARRRFQQAIAQAANAYTRARAAGTDFNDPRARAARDRAAGGHIGNYWVFTAWGRGDVRPNAGRKSSVVAFMCGQQERGPKEGRLHWQCYVEFNTRHSAVQAMDALGLDKNHTFIQPRGSATAKQAIDYCKKAESAVPGTYFQEGQERDMKMPEQMKEVGAMVREGAQFIDIFARFPVAAITYCPSIMKAITAVAASSGAARGKRSVFVVWIWGPTGTGKSKRVMERFPGTDVYILPLTTQKGMPWFDGMAGQPVLLIEELTGNSQIALKDLLRILDDYPVLLPVKGGYTQAVYNTVIITSNLSPEQAYADDLANADPNHVAAFRRRIPETNRIYIASVDQDVKTLGLGKCPAPTEEKRVCHPEDVATSRAAMELDGRHRPPPLPTTGLLSRAGIAIANGTLVTPAVNFGRGRGGGRGRGSMGRGGRGSYSRAPTPAFIPVPAPTTPAEPPRPVPPSPEPLRPALPLADLQPRLTRRALEEYNAIHDVRIPSLPSIMNTANEDVTTTVQRVDVDGVPIGEPELVKIPVAPVVSMIEADARTTASKKSVRAKRVPRRTW